MRSWRRSARRCARRSASGRGAGIARRPPGRMAGRATAHGGMMGDATTRQGRVEAGIRLEPQIHPRESATATIEQALARRQTPGCGVAVIEGGRLAWARGYGATTAGTADRAAVAADTIFQACSISKPVAALAAHRLVQAGRLELDLDVNAYLTSWQIPANGAWRPTVTLRHLLSHTAGLTYCWYPGYPRGSALPSTLDTLRGATPANTPPVRVTAVPGTQFRYSGSHFSVLQQLLCDVTGRPFPALLRELVLDPLGLADSGYETDFPARHRGATAVGHDAGGQAIAGGWRELPEGAGAGLWTTAGDLCRLACDVIAAWSGGPATLLDRATARQMLAAQIGGWGLGWSVGEVGGVPRFGHGGSNIGYKCQLVAWPSLGLGAAVMTNGDEGDGLVRDIMEAIGRVYRWPDARDADDRPGMAPLGDASAVFAGEFGGEGQPRATISADDGGLLLAVAGQPPLPLRAVASATFIAEDVNTEIRFTRGDDGAVTGLVLRQYGQELTLPASAAPSGRP